MRKTMTRILSGLGLAAALIVTPALAYDRDDLNRVLGAVFDNGNPMNDQDVACQDCDLRDADLSNYDMRGADLAGANLANAILTGRHDFLQGFQFPSTTVHFIQRLSLKFSPSLLNATTGLVGGLPDTRYRQA